MVCGSKYTFVSKKHFQFNADICTSLHSQICCVRSYRPLKAAMASFGRTTLAAFFTLLPSFLKEFASTSACKHTKPHLTVCTYTYTHTHTRTRICLYMYVYIFILNYLPHTYQSHCSVRVDILHILL